MDMALTFKKNKISCRPYDLSTPIFVDDKKCILLQFQLFILTIFRDIFFTVVILVESS